ncbi:nucleotidyltransferase domain-containing protein [Candidatus Pacearchaeota archaeon]|nr:nucleotidyltransferase domain-containing protein [Candidatus Pacearchaeota archaeon]
MEIIVKETREVGTSAGVLLPRKWLNKQVVVTLFSPSKAEIIKDILDILIDSNVNEDVKGIYLFGSYARGDYDSGSDIDVLVITDKTNKFINYKNYEALLVSENNFSRDLKNSLAYMSILKEIDPIINKPLIEKYTGIRYKLKIRQFLREIAKIIEINKETVTLCRDNNRNIPDGIVYSIVLRLRELYLIKCLFSNKNYSKRNFLEVCGEEAYSAYIRIKRDERELNNVSYDKAIKLIELSEKWLRELKS